MDIQKYLIEKVLRLSPLEVSSDLASLRDSLVISIDRDLNAALNIRNIGINTLGHSGINACGDGSLELSLKQEKECLVN